MIRSEKELYLAMEKLVQDTIANLDPERKLSAAQLAEKLGLTLSYTRLSGASEGMYVEDKNQIIINDSVWNEDRKKFTAFHEICHHLLNEDGDILSDVNELCIDNDVYDNFKERLCDIGAAEFLLPKHEISLFIKDNYFSVMHVDALSKRYEVSKTATAYRIAQCSSHKCIMAVCKIDFSITPPCIVIESSFKSPDMKYGLGKNSVLPRDHPLWDFIMDLDRQHTEIKSYIPFASSYKPPCDIEALRIKQRVYVAFNHSLPSSPDQLEMIF
jgi:Zn-dependent peptidase ImmA (M78 family)